MRQSKKPWWTIEDPIELAQCAGILLPALAQCRARRWERIQVFRLLYECRWDQLAGRSAEHVHAREAIERHLPHVDWGTVRPHLPLFHQVVTTVASRLISNLPTVKLAPRGAPMRLRPKLRKMSDALRGNIGSFEAQAQTRALITAGLRDGRGYVWPRLSGWGGVRYDALDYRQVLWDPRDGEHATSLDYPPSLWVWECVPRGQARARLDALPADRFGGQAAKREALEAIDKAETFGDIRSFGLTSYAEMASAQIGLGPNTDQIMIVHGFHRPSGPEAKDGRNVVLLWGAQTSGSCKVLLSSEWTARYHPIAAWSPFWTATGWEGFGMCDLVLTSQEEADRLAHRIASVSRKGGWPTLLLPTGSDDLLVTLRDEDIGAHQALPGEAAPISVTPIPLNAQDVDLLDRFLTQWGPALAGVNPMAAQGTTRLSGQASGVAQREERRSHDLRLGPILAEVDHLVHRVGRLTIDELDRAPGPVNLSWGPKGEDLRTATWSELRVANDQFWALDLEPAAADASSRADRIATIVELHALGQLDDGALQDALLGQPDLGAIGRLATAARRLCFHLVAMALDPEQPPERFRPPEETPFEECTRLTVATLQDVQATEEPDAEIVQRLAQLVSLCRMRGEEQAQVVSGGAPVAPGAVPPVAPPVPEGDPAAMLGDLAAPVGPMAPEPGLPLPPG